MDSTLPKLENNGWSLFYFESEETLIRNYSTQAEAIQAMIQLGLDNGGKIFKTSDHSCWYDTRFSSRNSYQGQIKLEELKKQIQASHIFYPGNYRQTEKISGCYLIKPIEFSKSPELKIIQSDHYIMSDQISQEKEGSIFSYFTWLSYLPSLSG